MVVCNAQGPRRAAALVAFCSAMFLRSILSLLLFALLSTLAPAGHGGSRVPAPCAHAAVASDPSSTLAPVTAPSAPALFPPDSAPTGLGSCTARMGGATRYITTTLEECPSDLTSAVIGWNPDVLVVLGGGILPIGQPGCATMQRALTAQRVFERLARRPYLVLSGRGPRRPQRDLDEAELTCALARRARDIASPSIDASERRALREDTRTLQRTRRRNLTEAEYMCAVILRQYPADERPSVLARMIFEAKSMSTAENVSRSTPILVRRAFRRVLVVSTPAFPAPGVVDDHTRRAVAGFRAARPSPAAYRVSGLTCPYRSGGNAWALFE